METESAFVGGPLCNDTERFLDLLDMSRPIGNKECNEPEMLACSLVILPFVLRRMHVESISPFCCLVVGR